MRPERLFEILAVAERLKCNTRHSWTSTGRRESVAEHSWRLALMALLVADEFPDVDCGRVVRMCLVHGRHSRLRETAARRNARGGVARPLGRDPARTAARRMAVALCRNGGASHTRSPTLQSARQTRSGDPAQRGRHRHVAAEYDLNIAYGADEVAWNGYLRRLKEAANEISRQKIAEARRQAPDDAGK